MPNKIRVTSTAKPYLGGILLVAVLLLPFAVKAQGTQSAGDSNVRPPVTKACWARSLSRCMTRN